MTDPDVPSALQPPDWTPPPGTVRREIFGIAATTEPLPSRRLEIARAALEGVVSNFKPTPMHIEHGIERQGTVLRVWLVDREDGVTELHYEGEIFLPAGVDPSTVVPSGMSISMIETERHTEDSPLVLGADSMTFDDDALEEARHILEAAPFDIVVERYHQFAVLPPPTIIVVVGHTAVAIGKAIAAAATWDLLKAAIRRLISRSKQPERPCHLRVRVPGAGDLNMELPVNAEDAVEVLDKVFEGVIGMVQAAASGATTTRPPAEADPEPPST